MSREFQNTGLSEQNDVYLILNMRITSTSKLTHWYIKNFARPTPNAMIVPYTRNCRHSHLKHLLLTSCSEEYLHFFCLIFGGQTLPETEPAHQIMLRAERFRCCHIIYNGNADHGTTDHGTTDLGGSSAGKTIPQGS